jgi:hypothetical protein
MMTMRQPRGLAKHSERSVSREPDKRAMILLAVTLWTKSAQPTGTTCFRGDYYAGTMVTTAVQSACVSVEPTPLTILTAMTSGASLAPRVGMRNRNTS